MVENEVKNYEGQLNMNPIEPQNFGFVENLPVEPAEATSCLQEVSEKTEVRFARRRIIRRVKSAGIF